MIERHIRIPRALAWVVLMTSTSCSLEDNHVSRDTRRVDLIETLSWLKQLSDEKFGGLSLTDLESIEELHFIKTKVTDQGLRFVRPLTTLKNLDLYCSHITGEGFKHLGSLASLTRLNLYKARNINDQGLEYISSLTSLRVLNLYRSNITDEGVKHLASLTSLTNLNLGHTGITGAAFKHLGTLTSLAFLDLSGCHEITEQGFRDLEKALPRCKVWR